MKRCYILEISHKPGYLLFTAPFKLCEGNCKEPESNFAMAFPIYVGKIGREKYKEMYERDYHKIQSTKPNAPFKKLPTKKLFTLCPSEVTKEQTIVIPTDTPETETLTTIPTVETPIVSQTEATETPTTDQPTVFETETLTEEPTMLETDMPTTDTPTRTIAETTTTELPVVPTTIITTIEDAMIIKNKEANYVTNANGVRCPQKKCPKKRKVTPKIITLAESDREEKGKLDMRNAQWSSEYSDLMDSLYSY